MKMLAAQLVELSSERELRVISSENGKNTDSVCSETTSAGAGAA